MNSFDSSSNDDDDDVILKHRGSSKAAAKRKPAMNNKKKKMKKKKKLSGPLKPTVPLPRLTHVPAHDHITSKQSWCPHDLPRRGHTRYHAAVAAIQNARTWSECDQWAPIVAYMETNHVYSDRALDSCWSVLAPSPELVYDITGVPDSANYATRVGLWYEKEMTYWSDLLTKALPNACKGRAIINALCADLENPIVYETILRILFGALLGLWGRVVPQFRERVALYAAFSLYPPSHEDLRAFLRSRKVLVEFCFRSYLLYMFKHTMFHDFLSDQYSWVEATAHVEDGMDMVRGALPDLIDSPQFLTSPGWVRIEGLLFVMNRDNKPLCFRAAKVPFYRHVLSEMRSKWRSEAQVMSNELRPRAAHLDFTLRASAAGTTHGEFMRRLTRVDRVVDAETADMIADAEAAYNGEQKMTLAKRMLVGTETKPGGIFTRDKRQFAQLMSFYSACHIRLRVHWQFLPSTWAASQLRGLRKTHGFLHDESGCYFFCPRCGDVKSRPVTFPAGTDPRIRGAAHMTQGVRNDLRTGRHICGSMSERRRASICRRRKRGPNPAKLNNEAHIKGDDVFVCGSTPLLTICMVGIILVFADRFMLLLCVHCGTLVKWSPRCIGPDGPSCGCHLIDMPEPNMSETCAICDNPEMKTWRVHTVITPDGIQNIRVCVDHKTHLWVDKEDKLFTLQYIRGVLEQKLRPVHIRGQLFFLPEKKVKKIG